MRRGGRLGEVEGGGGAGEEESKSLSFQIFKCHYFSMWWCGV